MDVISPPEKKLVTFARNRAITPISSLIVLLSISGRFGVETDDRGRGHLRIDRVHAGISSACGDFSGEGRHSARSALRLCATVWPAVLSVASARAYSALRLARMRFRSFIACA